MTTHPIMIRGQVYIAVTQGNVDHPQGQGKLVGLLKDGYYVWRHADFVK